MLEIMSLLPKSLASPLMRICLALGNKMNRSDPKLRVRLAANKEELERAARLLHDAYVHQQIIAPSPAGVRVTLHTLLPDSQTFVAEERGEIVGTMSLIPDSEAGLPIEALHEREVGALRRQGRRLAEVGAFAVTPPRRSSAVGPLLMRRMVETARQDALADDILVSCHPRAAAFYENILRFEKLSSRVSVYPGMRKTALEIGLRLDLRAFGARLLKAWAWLPLAPGNALAWLCDDDRAPPLTRSNFDTARKAQLAWLDSVLDRHSVASTLSPVDIDNLRDAAYFARRESSLPQSCKRSAS